MAVSKHYFDIEEDQFDFHSYCIRKMTLRAYIEMLRMVRNLVSTCGMHHVTPQTVPLVMLYHSHHKSHLFPVSLQEDSLYSALPYVRAAYGAIQTYVLLHDKPASSEQVCTGAWE